MQEQPPRPQRPPYRRRTGRYRSQPADASEVKERAARESVDILLRALTEAETVLAGAAEEVLRARQTAAPAPPTADIQETMRSVADYFGRVVDLIGEERRLLSEQVQAMSQAVERLEGQLDNLAEELRGLRQSRAATPTPRRTARGAPAREMEPLFAAGGEGVQVVITSVDSFQDLMDLQRALSAMPAVEGASVEGYLEGEARLVLHLREAVAADHIAETVRKATGQETAVEEARPEALRLRLRLGGVP